MLKVGDKERYIYLSTRYTTDQLVFINERFTIALFCLGMQESGSTCHSIVMQKAVCIHKIIRDKQALVHCTRNWSFVRRNCVWKFDLRRRSRASYELPIIYLFAYIIRRTHSLTPILNTFVFFSRIMNRSQNFIWSLLRNNYELQLQTEYVDMAY